MAGVEIPNILTGLQQLIPAHHRACNDVSCNVKTELLRIVLSLVEFWLKRIQNPQESMENRRDAIQILNCAANDKGASPIIMEALDRLDATSCVVDMANEMQDQHAITGGLWMISQLRGAAGVIAYLRQEKRPVGRSCAFWILGYPKVLRSISLPDCAQVLDSVCNYVANDNEELFRIIRLLGNCMLSMKNRSVSEDVATRVLKYLRGVAAESCDKKESWQTWLWSLGCLAQKSDIANSELWKNEFLSLPYEDILMKYYLDEEEVAEYTVFAVLHGLGSSTLLEKVKIWFNGFPNTYHIVAIGMKTLASNEESPPVIYKLLTEILPKAHASQQYKREKQIIVSAALALACQCGEDAAMNDDPVLPDILNLLLEAMHLFTTERTNISWCVDGLMRIVLRKPELAKKLRPLIVDGSLQKICLYFVNDYWVLPLCLQLAFAINDFDQIMRLLDITKHNSRALQSGLQALLSSLEDHSECWDSQKLRVLGTFVKERLVELRTADSHLRSQCYCLHVLVVAHEREPSLLDCATMGILFATFADVWNDPRCGAEVLCGMNKFLLSISQKQRKEEIPKIENSEIFVAAVKRAFRKFVNNAQFGDYEEQLRLVLLLLEGVEACFSDTGEKRWESQYRTLAAVDTFVRSTEGRVEKEVLDQLRCCLQAYSAQYYGHSDSSLFQKCTTLLGLLGVH